MKAIIDDEIRKTLYPEIELMIYQFQMTMFFSVHQATKLIPFVSCNLIVIALDKKMEDYSSISIILNGMLIID